MQLPVSHQSARKKSDLAQNLEAGLPRISFHDLIIFNHRIRKQIAAKIIEPRIEIRSLIVNLDLEILADPHRIYLRHAQMLHRIAHRCALRIEHGGFRRDEDFDLHVPIFGVGAVATSAIVNPPRSHASLRLASYLPAVPGTPAVAISRRASTPRISPGKRKPDSPSEFFASSMA